MDQHTRHTHTEINISIHIYTEHENCYELNVMTDAKIQYVRVLRMYIVKYGTYPGYLKKEICK